jgi:uncharacterized membrane protein
MKFLAKINLQGKLRVIATLLMMSLACCLLLAFRIYVTQQITYIFLVWNLFLALVPLWIAYKSYKVHHRYPARYFLVLSMILFWLLFFPNAPYIVTDFIHLQERAMVPLWFDAMLVFSFAVTGLLSGVISLYFIHEILNRLINKVWGWAMVGVISVLSGYGVYLGRVLRWNSWDLFFHTRALLTDSILQWANPAALAMTGMFALLLLFTYILLLNFLYIKKEGYDH